MSVYDVKNVAGGGVMLKAILLAFIITVSFATNTIKCGILSDFSPFTVQKNSKVDGISVEYWKIVSKQLNIKTTYKVFNKWEELLKAFKTHKIDMILTASNSMKLKNSILSNKYDKFSIVIATKDDISFIPDIRVLKPYPIGLIKDSISYNIIKHKYPNLKFVIFNNIKDALKSLEDRKIKAIVGLLPILVYGINQNSYFSIRISGQLNIPIQLSFMFNNKYKYLIPKVNHTLQNITIQERLKLYKKWLKLDNFWTWERIEFVLFIGIVILISLFILIFILKRDIKRRNLLEEELLRQKEKAQKAVKVKSEFLANMSHEIRTPLNAMFGFITILKESEKDKERYKYLKVVERCGINLLNIINDILDFSKIEAGKFSIEKIEFNPREELEAIYSLFVAKAIENNITLHIEEKDLNYMIITDPTRLKQIVSNLLSNAIKFTPSNKNVYLKLKYNKNKELLYVEVEDEGIGIEKDKLNTIFDSFSQADNSTTRKYGGTGLGLSISYKLVEMLGGELKVKSEVNKGSKFYFTITAKRGKIIKTNPKIKSKKVLNKKYNHHILLVEDNQANQMFMKVILQKLNITFDIANDGLEAIEYFKKNKYDLILMDENMPNMNGIEATKKIREYEHDKKLNPIIIVALTANALDGDKERFILAGMNYYLSKPLNIEKLKEILNTIGLNHE